MEAIPKINVKDLKPHPINNQIYGEEDIKELAEKIKESGWIKPLIIKPDGTVISGHRRLKACIMLGIEKVEYEVVHFNNKNEELERLLLENQSREKTNEQKIREGLMWEKVIKEKARLRQLSTLNNQSVDKENFPYREQGQTRDRVAEKIDIGSGKTYDSAKKVVKEIDNLKEQGKKKDAEFVKTTLNESVNGAKNILKTDLSKIDEGLKDKVINKEISAKEVIKEIKKKAETIKKDEFNMWENSQQNDIETPTATKEESKELQEKIIESFEKQTSIIPDNIISDFEVDKGKFIENMSKYIELKDQFLEINQEDKKKLTNCVEDMKTMLDKFMNLIW